MSALHEAELVVDGQALVRQFATFPCYYELKLEVLSRDDEDRILLALAPPRPDDLPESAHILSDEVPPRPVRARAAPKNKREGLTVCEPEPIEEHGECPGGEYWYLEDVAQATELLHYWADQQCWAAVDLETSQCWRERTNPETGEKTRYFTNLIDPFTCVIFLCSVSVEPGKSIVFAMRPLMQDEGFKDAFRRFLTDCKIVVHNAMFEAPFFRAQFGVDANIAYDTLLVSQLANAGRDRPNSLEALLIRNFDVHPEKSWQRFFMKLHPESPIPNGAIAYSAGDVTMLLPLVPIVHKELADSEMEHIWNELEWPLIPHMVAARIAGVRVDPVVLAELSVQLSASVAEEKARFAALTAPETVLISSWQQVKGWFAAQGVNLKNTNETSLKEVIVRQGNTLPAQAAQAILDYREKSKALSTYIKPFMESHPSPVTGRIHTNWKQLQASTGRMASDKPNLQNIPREGLAAQMRKAFLPLPGHLMVTADYSQFELRILAELSGEPLMVNTFKEAWEIAGKIEAYCRKHELPENIADVREHDAATWATIAENHPELEELFKAAAHCDFHTRTAAQLFNVPIEEVTKAQRSIAKTFNFQIAYGAGAPGLSQKAGIPLDYAKQLLEAYNEGMPILARCLKTAKIQAREQGYTCTIAGRKRFYERPDMEVLLKRYREEQAEHDAIMAEWEANIPEEAVGDAEWYHANCPTTTWMESMETWHRTNPYEVAQKKYFYELSSIEREGCNHPVQGCNADAAKLATILAAPRLRELHPECIILMWVHDEIVVSAPECVAHQAAKILKEAMIEAATRYVKDVPIDVSVAVAPCWTK